ncbi:MAG: rhodanese-like domain-containing protein [Bacteroidetes bacterium]|nr:rhodanese-like domain-containing protein [Bacteroidota bacterium]
MKINYLFAGFAVIAGLLAAFTNHADRNGLYPTWEFKKQLISSTYLADLIYTKKKNFVLVDLRADTAYQEYHIPSAVPVTQLQVMNPENADMIVCYGTDQKSSVEEVPDEFQGELYVLSGGIQEWYKLVLFPDFEKFQVRNKKLLEEIISKSRYFGGNPKNLQELNITERSGQFREGC